MNDKKRAVIQTVFALGSIESARIHFEACIVTIRTLCAEGLITQENSVIAENQYQEMQKLLLELKEKPELI